MSTIRVGGLLLADFSNAGGELDQRALTQTMRGAGYAIVSGKGYTSYGVATAIVRICEAIVRDERIILPVSTSVDGVFGLSGGLYEHALHSWGGRRGAHVDPAHER